MTTQAVCMSGSSSLGTELEAAGEAAMAAATAVEVMAVATAVVEMAAVTVAEMAAVVMAGD